MSDAAQSPTDDPRAVADDLVADLRDARDALRRARERVDEVGESELREVADAYDDLTGREVATPDETRSFLGLKGKERTAL
jgi:hypothetical protein